MGQNAMRISNWLGEFCGEDKETNTAAGEEWRRGLRMKHVTESSGNDCCIKLVWRERRERNENGAGQKKHKKRKARDEVVVCAWPLGDGDWGWSLPLLRAFPNHCPGVLLCGNAEGPGTNELIRLGQVANGDGGDRKIRFEKEQDGKGGIR